MDSLNRSNECLTVSSCYGTKSILFTGHWQYTCPHIAASSGVCYVGFFFFFVKNFKNMVYKKFKNVDKTGQEIVFLLLYLSLKWRRLGWNLKSKESKSLELLAKLFRELKHKESSRYIPAFKSTAALKTRLFQLFGNGDYLWSHIRKLLETIVFFFGGVFFLSTVVLGEYTQNNSIKGASLSTEQFIMLGLYHCTPPRRTTAPPWMFRQSFTHSPSFTLPDSRVTCISLSDVLRTSHYRKLHFIL